MSRRAELLLLYLRYLKKRQAREKGPAESGCSAAGHTSPLSGMIPMYLLIMPFCE
jgi:hypothetical protein